MIKAERFERIIFEPGGVKIVPIGKTGRQSCTTVPDDMTQLRNMILQWDCKSDDKTHARGPGDDYIATTPGCEVKYYKNGKLISHLK